MAATMLTGTVAVMTLSLIVTPGAFWINLTSYALALVGWLTAD